jgi:hypothetical protein
MEAANAAAHRGAWAEIARLLDAADPPLAALRREVDAARGDAGGASIATVCAPREAPAP